MKRPLAVICKNTVFGVCLYGLVFMPVIVSAQSRDETLADIRQDLSYLNGQIMGLRRELSTTGGVSAISSDGPALQRLDELEREMRRLTGSLEQLQFRIDRVVKDGTNRVGDLEFRLIELEGGDLSQVGKTLTLGGEEASLEPAVSVGADNSEAQAELTVTEQGDFENAFAAFRDGDYGGAVDQFDQFVVTYPSGPLSGEAYYWKGEALAGLADWSNAARSFLESFSGSPKGSLAPNALFRLGVSLYELNQPDESCLTLTEVGLRYPDADVVGEAHQQMQNQGCS